MWHFFFWSLGIETLWWNHKKSLKNHGKSRWHGCFLGFNIFWSTDQLPLHLGLARWTLKSEVEKSCLMVPRGRGKDRQGLEMCVLRYSFTCTETCRRIYMLSSFKAKSSITKSLWKVKKLSFQQKITSSITLITLETIFLRNNFKNSYVWMRWILVSEESPCLEAYSWLSRTSTRMGGRRVLEDFGWTRFGVAWYNRQVVRCILLELRGRKLGVF